MSPVAVLGSSKCETLDKEDGHREAGVAILTCLERLAKLQATLATLRTHQNDRGFLF